MAVVTGTGEGLISINVNMQDIPTPSQRWEADLARAVRNGSSVEFQFAQLRAFSSNHVAYALVVRLDGSMYQTRLRDPVWKSFHERCRETVTVRSQEELAKIWDGLNTDSAQFMTLRAMFERSSQFAGVGTVLFSTIASGVLHSRPIRPGERVEGEIHPIVEVTMNLPVLVELLDSCANLSFEE